MSTSDVPVSGRDVAGGVGAGIAAYVLGYLVTYVLHRSSIEEDISVFNTIVSLFGGDPIPAWQGVGWLFYNAHLVDTVIGSDQTSNIIASTDGATFTLLYAVPIVLLFAGGAALAVFSNPSSPLDGTITGMQTVLGYFPLAVIGVFVFAYSVADTTVQPDLITAVLLAGIVYPLLFGGLGGTVATVLQSE